MIDRGCEFSKDVRVQNRSDGQAVDITAYEFEATLKDADGNELLEMSTANGNFTVLDGEEGSFRIVISEDDTAGLTLGPVSAVIYKLNPRKRWAKIEDIVREAE